MTIKTCVVCGELGHGVLVPCSHCGYRPQTSWEIGYSILHSDYHQSRSSLEEHSAELRRRYVVRQPFWHKLSPSEIHHIFSFLEKPDGRDSLELRRGAKNTFFAKQLKFHFIGPDGYEARIVQRGRDIDKREYDGIARSHPTDVFLLSVYDHGKRDDRIAPKNIWYAMRDYYALIERRMRGEEKMVSIVAAHARHGTLEFLAGKGLDIRSLEAPE
ncbi:hypothetical protein [Albidovulum sp.]|uniref:hypothetical protein n=1 Tax=Albidovulum sp. TaxID=1872424 RepID=UPI0039B9BE21